MRNNQRMQSLGVTAVAEILKRSIAIIAASKDAMSKGVARKGAARDDSDLLYQPEDNEDTKEVAIRLEFFLLASFLFYDSSVPNMQ
jgi:hypothetical protein